MPETSRQEYSDQDCLSAPQLRELLGGKGLGRMLSEHGLQALVREGLIPKPFLLGKFRRWRYGAIKAALAKLEKAAEGA